MSAVAENLVAEDTASNHQFARSRPAYDALATTAYNLQRCLDALKRAFTTDEDVAASRVNARYIEKQARDLAVAAKSIRIGLGDDSPEPSDMEFIERCAVVAYLAGHGFLDVAYNRERWLDVPPLTQKLYRDMAGAVIAEFRKAQS